MESANEFLTNREAAKFLRTSELTLWRLRKNGELPFYRIASKLLYRVSDLERYMQSNKRNDGGQNDEN